MTPHGNIYALVHERWVEFREAKKPPKVVRSRLRGSREVREGHLDSQGRWRIRSIKVPLIINVIGFRGGKVLGETSRLKFSRIVRRHPKPGTVIQLKEETWQKIRSQK